MTLVRLALRASLRSSLQARTGVLGIAGGAVLWGTTGVVAHAVHAASGLSPVSVAFYRTAVAAAVLALLRGPALVRQVRAMSRGGLALLAAAGATLGASQALYFVAVTDAGVSLSTLICIGVAPVVVTGATAVVERRRPGADVLVPLAGALVGLALITTSTRSAPGARPVVGAVAALGSGLAYAVSTLLSRRLAARVEALTLTGATSAAAALTLLPAAALAGLALRPQPSTLSALAYLGLITTVLAYRMFFSGLRTTGA
jgi:DME family drug/metabolite transporter